MNLRTETMQPDIETQQALHKSVPARAFCEGCERRVDLVTFTEAEEMLGVDRETFFRLSEEGKIHWLQKSTGVIMACLRSVKTYQEHRQAKIIILKPLQPSGIY